MDAITMLKDDHHTVEKLFKDFEKAGERAHVTKRKLVDRMIEELSRHAVIEEQLFYPATSATIPEIEDQMRESIEEHHVVKWLLSELEKADVEDEQFDAKVTVLIESVRHHVKEEEEEYFPKVRDTWAKRPPGPRGAHGHGEGERLAAPAPRGTDDPSREPAGRHRRRDGRLARRHRERHRPRRRGRRAGPGRPGAGRQDEPAEPDRLLDGQEQGTRGAPQRQARAWDAAVDAVDEARRRGEKTTKTARQAVRGRRRVPPARARSRP